MYRESFSFIIETRTFADSTELSDRVSPHSPAICWIKRRITSNRFLTNKMTNHWFWVQNHVITLKKKWELHLCIILLHLESSRDLISLCATIVNQSFMLSCSEGTHCKQPHKPSQHFYIMSCSESSIILATVMTFRYICEDYLPAQKPIWVSNQTPWHVNQTVQMRNQIWDRFV